MDRDHPLKLAAIGGGTGLANLLKGLKPYLDSRRPDRGSDGMSISLTAIVTVTDNGRSSGRLRSEFAILPPGDIRNCLVALADESEVMARLFSHRFPGDGPIGGHSLGNLIILALNQIGGDFLLAIETAREMLGIRARVLPSTTERVDLVARIGDRQVRGQVDIKSQNAPIRDLSLTPAFAAALPDAVEAILDADLITLGPGSLFTSVIPNLLVGGIAQALTRSKAKKVYICNAMTEYDETDGFSAVDHVRQLLYYAPELRLDYALFNSEPISDELRNRYATERAVALEPPRSMPADLAGIKLVALPLASETRFVRHDPVALCRALFDIYDN